MLPEVDTRRIRVVPEMYKLARSFKILIFILNMVSIRFIVILKLQLPVLFLVLKLMLLLVRVSRRGTSCATRHGNRVSLCIFILGLLKLIVLSISFSIHIRVDILIMLILLVESRKSSCCLLLFDDVIECRRIVPFVSVFFFQYS